MKRLIAVILLAATSAFADGNKIDFTVVLKAPDGGAFMECVKMDQNKCVETANLTLGALSIAAISNNEKSAPGVEQLARGKLAYKIYQAKSASLSVEEVKLLKDALLSLKYNSLAVYQAVKLLDPSVE